MPNNEGWYIAEEDKWGFTEIFDGPFDSENEAIREIEKMEDDDPEAAENLFVQQGDHTKTSFYE